MEEDVIAIRFDRRKLDALKVALYAEGEDLDQSLEKYIGKLYADKVPKNERAKIERQIQEEINAEQEEQDRFIAVRLQRLPRHTKRGECNGLHLPRHRGQHSCGCRQENVCGLYRHAPACGADGRAWPVHGRRRGSKTRRCVGRIESV